MVPPLRSNNPEFIEGPMQEQWIQDLNKVTFYFKEKPMQVKLIITDLDGTAIDSPVTHSISAALARAIQRADDNGIKVSAATGRALIGTRHLFTEMSMKDPVIISGGARIIDPISEDIIWGLDIPEASFNQILEVISDESHQLLWNDFSAEDYLGGAWPKSKLTTSKGIYFFEICYVPEAEAKVLTKKLEAIPDIAVVQSSAWGEGKRDLHIMNKLATKEHAIYELQKMLGITKEETVGVGDGHNDLHIFNAVGHRVAIGNAVPELKAEADQIIGSVKEDGLAKFIEELVSNKGKL